MKLSAHLLHLPVGLRRALVPGIFLAHPQGVDGSDLSAIGCVLQPEQIGKLPSRSPDTVNNVAKSQIFFRNITNS